METRGPSGAAAGVALGEADATGVAEDGGLTSGQRASGAGEHAAIVHEAIAPIVASATIDPAPRVRSPARLT
jgi:hypothetical protein